jgi:hypothetical protein
MIIFSCGKHQQLRAATGCLGHPARELVAVGLEAG